MAGPGPRGVLVWLPVEPRALSWSSEWQQGPELTAFLGAREGLWARLWGGRWQGRLLAAPVPQPLGPGGTWLRELPAGPPCVCPQILESSQTLLSVLKREAGNLTKATASEQKSSAGKDS